MHDVEVDDRRSYANLLQLPGDIPVGTYALDWQTPIPGQRAEEAQNIRITAAPPMCKQSQLDFSVGRTGVR